MAAGTYAVVWMDSEEARIIFLNNNNAVENGGNRSSVRLHRQSKHVNPQTRRATDEHVYYQKIANDLTSVQKFLVLGPADAKVQFVKHLRRYDPRLISHLSVIETIDGMIDGEFLEIARAHFHRAYSATGERLQDCRFDDASVVGV